MPLRRLRKPHTRRFPIASGSPPTTGDPRLAAIDLRLPADRQGRATSPGGIRSSPASRKPCMRPGFGARARVQRRGRAAGGEALLTISSPGRANGQKGRNAFSQSSGNCRAVRDSPPAHEKNFAEPPFFRNVRGLLVRVCRAATPVPPVPDAALISAPVRLPPELWPGRFLVWGASSPRKTAMEPRRFPPRCLRRQEKKIEQERAHAAPSDRTGGLECRRPGAGISAGRRNEGIDRSNHPVTETANEARGAVKRP